jgi:hypothetical protein
MTLIKGLDVGSFLPSPALAVEALDDARDSDVEDDRNLVFVIRIY